MMRKSAVFLLCIVLMLLTVCCGVPAADGTAAPSAPETEPIADTAGLTLPDEAIPPSTDPDITQPSETPSDTQPTVSADAPVETDKPVEITEPVAVTEPAKVTEPAEVTEPTQATEPPETSGPAPIPSGSKQEKIEAYISGMSIEEKVYQLFIVTGEDISGGSTMTSVTNTVRSNLEKYPVGGIIFFARNLKNPQQTKTMLSQLQEEAIYNTGLPLFTCVDEEGGTVARIANNSAFGVEKFGNMSTVASEGDAYYMGTTIGSYLYDLGFNFNFAPVADTTTDGISSVIGSRSFGNDPQKVSLYAAAVSRGLNDRGVLSCYKHFPGHGATATDTHYAFAYTSKTKEELLSHDLIPFMQASGVPAIMVAHISAPALSGDNTPCSLSYAVITQLLRNEFGYQGLILTDALNMGAIVNTYGSGTAAVMALKAGNDLLLVPNNFEAAVSAVLQAVENGEITESRIDQSLRRILAAKL